MIEATERIPKIDEEYTNNVNDLSKNEDIDQVTKAQKLLEIEQKYFKDMDNAFDSFSSLKFFIDSM